MLVSGEPSMTSRGFMVLDCKPSGGRQVESLSALIGHDEYAEVVYLITTGASEHRDLLFGERYLEIHDLSLA